MASRRLQSGDTLLTFTELASAYKASDEWIPKAFGENAGKARRELTAVTYRLGTDQGSAGGQRPAQELRQQAPKDQHRPYWTR